MKDAPSSYYLYPGTALYYELKIKHIESGKEWSVLRRFSEVRKFWEQIRPTCAAVGATLDPFPQHSAVLSGAGYTGNLYETNPKSEFATERIRLLSIILTQFNTKSDATGGSLLDLKMARSFFEIDKQCLDDVTPDTQASMNVEPSSNQSVQPITAQSTTGGGEKLTASVDNDWLSTLTRSTPATFFVVFVVVLATLYAFATEQHQ
uniref:PX domain-containing protein n=1 Tax=Aureoumbra lagunensis TaxID=44058 RepID=A0A7S3JN19_9STRA